MLLSSTLPAFMVEPIIRTALQEDLGQAGDVTSTAIIPADLAASLMITARQPGVVAGLDVAAAVFRLVDPAIGVEFLAREGGDVEAGAALARVRGPARALLVAERTALNFLCRMSGIATATSQLVTAVRGCKARIVCTRKTTPGLRMLEKYAVRAGGGFNHRFGLDSAVLIKDNHIAIAGGIRPAVQQVRARVGHMIKVEVEVDNLMQLDELLPLGVDAVLLDNMSIDDLARAVKMVDGRLVTEASGRITAAIAPEVAATGVDLISAGWLTHSAPILDIGLDFDRLEAAGDNSRGGV